MSDLSSLPSSSPAVSASTLPSSVPSPELRTLSLTDPAVISDQDKADAAQLKAEANKAFTSKHRVRRHRSPACVGAWWARHYPVLISLTRLRVLEGHDYPTAARLYSEAIEKNPSAPTLWCNRAYARMKLEEYGYALTDASGSIVWVVVWDGFSYSLRAQVMQSSWTLDTQRHITGKCYLHSGA